MVKTEKSTVTEITKTEQSTATEKTTTIEEITTPHTSPTLSGNNVVLDKVYLFKNGEMIWVTIHDAQYNWIQYFY